MLLVSSCCSFPRATGTMLKLATSTLFSATFAALLLTAGADINAAPAAGPGLPGLETFGQVEAELRDQLDRSSFQTPAGSLTNGTKSPFGNIKYVIGQSSPALFTLPNNGLAQQEVYLGPCALWAPHYHPRANEILFVAEGNVTMAFAEENEITLANGAIIAGNVFNYTTNKGDSLVVPQGLIHYVNNPYCNDATIITFFDNRDPGVVSILQRFFALPSAIVAIASGLDEVAVNLANTTVQKSAGGIIGADSTCLTNCNSSPQASPGTAG